MHSHQKYICVRKKTLTKDLKLYRFIPVELKGFSTPVYRSVYLALKKP